MLVFKALLDFSEVSDLMRTSDDALVVYCAVGLCLVSSFWSQISPEVEVELIVEENSSRRHRFSEGLPDMFSDCSSRLTLVTIPSEKVVAYKFIFIFVYICSVN